MKNTKQNTMTQKTLRNSAYVNDNLARAQAAPDYRPQHETAPKQERRVVRQAAPVIGIRKRMGLFGCTLMLGCFLVFAYSLVMAGIMNGRTQDLDHDIAKLNNEYARLVRMNDENEQAIASDIDINRVYEIAVGQYGMVYPRDNEVIALSAGTEGYVRQYTSVAEENAPEESPVERILGKIMR